MLCIFKGLGRKLRDRDGATAIEYGLIAGLLALVLVGALTNLGTTLNTGYSNITTTVSSAGG